MRYSTRQNKPRQNNKRQLPPQILAILLLIISTLISTGIFARSSLRQGLDQEMVKTIVVEEARALGVDPALALAIAQVESDFNPNAVSHVGARGVMQIMPKTAKDEFGLNPSILFDARINIRTGITFIKQLKQRYGDIEFALSHYNGGSRVTGPDGQLRVIPATRGYVDKVLARMENFQAYRAVEQPNGNQGIQTYDLRNKQNKKPYRLLAMSGDETGLSYRKMKQEAKKQLTQELRDLRQKNRKLATLVRTKVDPYLNRYRSNLSNSFDQYAGHDKRALVQEWESVYRD